MILAPEDVEYSIKEGGFVICVDIIPFVGFLTHFLDLLEEIRMHAARNGRYISSIEQGLTGGFALNGTVYENKRGNMILIRIAPYPNSTPK